MQLTIKLSFICNGQVCFFFFNDFFSSFFASLSNPQLLLAQALWILSFFSFVSEPVLSIIVEIFEVTILLIPETL